MTASAPQEHGLRDHFGLVLLCAIVTYTLLVTVETDRWVPLVAGIPVAVTVIVGVEVSAARPPLRYAAFGLAVAALVLATINAARKGPDPEGISLLLTGFALGVTVIAMLARMALHTRVTVRTVLSVVAAYVMLGLFFSYIDQGIGHITGQFFAQAGAHSPSDYTYFSYITLTTVGFGDLTPLSGLARSVTTLEALTGQVFLVTLVARMVSLYGTERAPFDVRSRRLRREEFEGPE